MLDSSMAAIAIALVMTTSNTKAPDVAPSASVRELAWLSGCWQVEGSEPGSIEQWMAPAGDSLIGMSRTISGGKTVFFEFLQIRAKAQNPQIAQRAVGQNQTLVFIAQPNGIAPTEFVLSAKGDKQLRFSAAGHDFPQHVNYQWLAKDRLSAWIEGLENGKAKRVDFPMRRVRCVP